MEIGTSDDQSAVTGIFPIGDNLYVVKERGIYEVKLADRIDPNRTNIAIPNTQQKVLNYGSEAPVVGRTLQPGDPAPDFAMLARSFGWHAEGPIVEPAKVRPALERALAVVRTEKRPALVDTVVRHREEKRFR